MTHWSDERLEDRLRGFYGSKTDLCFTFDTASNRESTPLSLMKSRVFVTAAGVILATALGMAEFLFFRPNPAPLTASVIPTQSAAVSPYAIDETAPSSESPTDVPESAAPVSISPSDSPTQDAPATHQRILPEKKEPFFESREPSEHETEQPKPVTEPSFASEAPTELNVPQTDGPEITGSGIYCEAQFEYDRLMGCETVYCRLFDENRMIGDTDLYSDEHIAYVSFLPDRTVFVSYNLLDLRERGVDVQKGRYHFWFYTVKGDAYEGIINFDPDG